MVFGRNKYRKEFENCQRALTEQTEKLSNVQRQFANYRKDTEAKLTKKEEIIKKFGDRWSSLESDVVKKEEELRSRLEAMDTTQNRVIEDLKKVNHMKSKTIDLQKEHIEKQSEKIQVQEDLLERAKEAIQNLSDGISTEEAELKHCLTETREQAEQIENLEKVISSLSSKVNGSELEANNTIAKLQLDVTNQNNQLKTLDAKLSSLKDMNNELVVENKELKAKAKEGAECLKTIEESRKEVEEKNKQMEAYKMQTERLSRIEGNLSKAINQNESMKKALEEKNKEIRKVNKISKLKEQIMKDEIKLNARDETVERLNDKWQTLEQAVTEFEEQCRAEFNNAKDRFTEKINSKNALLETLIASEQQAIFKLNKAEETIKHLENESMLREMNLLEKEKLTDDLNDKLEVVVIENSVLQFQLFQSEIITNKERANIEADIVEKLKQVNEIYQKQRVMEYDFINDYIDLLETAVIKEIEEYEDFLHGNLEALEETIQGIMQTTREENDANKRKLEEQRDAMESLQVKAVATEAQNRELKLELDRRDKLYDDLKRQMSENMKLLQNEILKSEVGPDMSRLGVKADSIPSMECVLRQIHTRNVVMKELRDEVEVKHDALVRIQDRYARLSEKIKRVTVAVTDAKAAYEDLERENRKLRASLKKRQVDESIDQAMNSRRRGTKTRTILETFGAYDMQVTQAMDIPPPCHIPSTPPSHIPATPPSPPVDALCEELKSIKKKNKTNILRLGFKSEGGRRKSADCKECGKKEKTCSKK